MRIPLNGRPGGFRPVPERPSRADSGNRPETGPLAAEKVSITVTVGEWPPYISQNLKHKGVIAHMVRDIFAEEGINAEIRFFPWARAYAETARGQYAATGVWMRKQEREKDFHYCDPVLTESFVFFHRADFDFHWNRLEDLRDFRIGGGVKYSYGSAMDTALESGLLKIERVPETRQNFTKLLLGRIDIFPEEKNVGYATLNDHFPSGARAEITHHPTALLNNLSFLLFPRSRPDSPILLEKFNRRLKLFRESGLYEHYLNNMRDGHYL